jgi:3-oxoadipyl-CoA thiolase
MGVAREAYLVEPVRTPVGRLRGALREVRPDDLAALAIAETLKRAKVDPAAVEDAILGCANQAGEDNRNVARMAVLLAGLPDSVPGVTVNRLCASGLEAVIQAAHTIRSGGADLLIAGGVESMTRAPWAVPKPADGYPGGKWEMFDTSLGWRFPNPRLAARFPLEQMGETAENVAEKYAIGREAQDRFALESHKKAVDAARAGRFADELMPVEISQKKGPAEVVREDEGPRPDTSLEKLAALKPAFRPGGTVTAGNSSSLNDGACAMVVASGEAVKRHGLKPLARFVAAGAAGVDPRVMGIGPVPATRIALKRAGLEVKALDAVELNEAFAVQALAVIRDLELDPARVNPNGGAIALGHPLGCSGARLVTTLAHHLKRTGGKVGLATLCVGVGQGVAALFERA